jgi:hypothetical protein
VFAGRLKHWLSFKDDGDIPNHPRWPLLLYPRAPEPDTLARSEIAFDELFAKNDWIVRFRAGSIRLRHALRHAGLAQAFDDALILRVEGRIVGPADAGPGLQVFGRCFSATARTASRASKRRCGLAHAWLRALLRSSGNRDFGLRDGRSPLPFGEEDPRL